LAETAKLKLLITNLAGLVLHYFP